MVRGSEIFATPHTLILTLILNCVGTAGGIGKMSGGGMVFSTVWWRNIFPSTLTKVRYFSKKNNIFYIPKVYIPLKLRI